MQLEVIKSDFIEMILHKFRNPLTSIKTSLAMLRSGKISQLPDSLKEVVDLSFDEVNRLHTLVNDLRHTFLIEAGLSAKETYLEQIDFFQVLDRVYSELEKIFNMDVRKRFKIVGESKQAIRGDFEKLKTALFNLFKNSLVYSNPDTQIRLTLKEQETQLILLLQDNGQGIPAPEVSQIFKKFYRANPQDTPYREGNGLGLYITKNFLADMHASVYCESKQGDGTAFTVSLPLARED
jgi:signal transduction histidine kinase